MAADVKSIEALTDWRIELVNFRQDGMDTIASIHNDVQKAFGYLDDQEAFWKRERRHAEEELVEAKVELSRREIPDYSGKTPDTTLQKKRVLQCKHRVEYCEDQMDVCKRWRTHLPKMVSEEYEGPARRLQNFLELDLARGIAGMDKQIDALERYANIGKTPTAAPPVEAAS